MSEQQVKDEEIGAPNTEVKSFSQKDVEELLKKNDKKWEERTSGMRDKMDDLLSETKKAKESERKIAEERAKQENDYKSLFESSQQKSAEWEAKFNELQNGIRKEKRQSSAMSISSELASGANAKLLAKFVADRVDIDENGNTVVLSSEGKPTVATLEDLKREIRSSGEFDALLDGSKASGSGAAKTASGGAGGRIDLTKASKQEKLEYFKQKRGV